jgi:pimeloyl-ACP methyl ester carboxylesterase
MFMPEYTRTADDERTIDVRVANFTLEGTLAIPRGAQGLVLFAHGSGSSRHSPRNRFVAALLRESGLATLLIDLLTPAEEAMDQRTADYRFDIDLLASRLSDATGWLGQFPETRRLNLGYFGASTGAAAALLAAAERPDIVSAIVSRGGRPDLAGPALARVQAPTLLLVGAEDEPIIDLNRAALAALPGEKRLDLIPNATHLFEEPGALELVAQLAREWFEKYLMT